RPARRAPPPRPSDETPAAAVPSRGGPRLALPPSFPHCTLRQAVGSAAHFVLPLARVGEEEWLAVPVGPVLADQLLGCRRDHEGGERLATGGDHPRERRGAHRHD